MKITMLGTGHAVVTKCYNTCFTIEENGSHFLVDAGGGNSILRILEEKKISLLSIHDIFVSHAHTDHMLGVIWVLRLIGHMIMAGKYEGELNVYCHKELAHAVETICGFTLPGKVMEEFGRRIRFVAVEDRECHDILGRKVMFFDIHSKKEKQFGFVMNLSAIEEKTIADVSKQNTCEPNIEEQNIESEKRLVFCGDEPLNETVEELAQDAEWMMHEAFCLYEDREIFKPYEKHHSTAKDASELAERLHVKNLVLYHTEDSKLAMRKELYTAEGGRSFGGNLFVPDDGEVIII